MSVCTPPKINSSPLKNDGWKTILSYWGPVTNFRGELLIFGQDISLLSHIQAHGFVDLAESKPNSVNQFRSLGTHLWRLVSENV